MIKPWEKLESLPPEDYRIFKIRTERKRSPRTGQTHDFFVIDTVDWVNVVAVTTAGQIVMVEQYRHGTNSLEIEVPGGMIDPHDASPLQAAHRELLEETGYQSALPGQIIGKISPNPAIMSNTCHTVLLEQCEFKQPPQLDQTEDVVTRTYSLAEIKAMLRNGQIRHSLVHVALHHYLQFLGE